MLKGIHVPLVTPFGPAGEVALDAVEKLAGHLLDQGAAGLVALGTTGEVAALSPAERAAVVEVCARVCRERDVPLTVGVTGNEPRSVLTALRELPDGVAAALVTVPYFLRPGERGVIAYFEALAAGSPVPLVIYHIPYRTGQQVSAATLRHLGRHPRVAGVKYAAGGIDQDAVDLLGEPPAEFDVLGGDDVFVSPLLALGASGGILASAHLATGRFAELVAAWQAGDAVRARELGHRLARLSATLFAEPNPTVVKGVLHARGLIPTPDVRLPLLPAGAEAVARALSECDMVAVHPGE
ncbi:4-hydroxy-tetrahydrodipicolinate synthase family protein [Nonomuraea muscovyensis]|uniref:4-hydroxy-tetrahydrodipicolinate synthase n=1 Tax=Nonomuraea muscovyensis TaxID=1124761 RepID=A0A7X0C001_9ACTN|nr:4-hydroxy-tetrahydrodipicolinate synthase [Nonomuraea muscovyensis]MBB6345955.1 4-hydroxy-tetrahydrodipicolinate synthase [Nonomuraea muscovyensis]MDF2711560.1 4-hydroxy-tetrahydrodipicolinate synthase [Nonomuraea muscovyensis]